MAIETVVQFADDQLTKAKADQTAAAAALAAAKQAAQVAADKIAELGGTLAAAQARDRELQAMPRPSAAVARDLADQQAEHEVLMHSITAQLAVAREASAKAAAIADAAQADYTRTQARVDQFERLKKSADTAAKNWEGTETAAEAASNLAVSIPATVDDIKAHDPYKAAKKRANDDVPEKLRDEGRKRTKEVRKKKEKAIEDEQDALIDLADTNKTLRGKFGAAAPARLAYEMSQQQVRELAGAVAELNDIKGRLQAIADAPPTPAAPSGQAEIETAGKDAANNLTNLRKKFEDAKKDVADQKQAIVDKQAEIDAAVAAGTPTNALDAELLQLNNDLPGLEAEVPKAEQKVKDAETDLDRWEGSVSDAAWQRLLAFDEADLRLDYLKATFTPAAIANMRNKLKATELELVKALDAEMTATRAIEDAEAVALSSQSVAAAIREVYDANQLAAIRGDV